VDGNLYVRAYNGTNSSWYQAATKQKAGRIAAGGLTKEVAFETVEDKLMTASMMPIERNISRAHI